MMVSDMVNMTFYVILLTQMVGNAHWSVIVAFAMFAIKDCMDSHKAWAKA